MLCNKLPNFEVRTLQYAVLNFIRYEFFKDRFNLHFHRFMPQVGFGIVPPRLFCNFYLFFQCYFGHAQMTDITSGANLVRIASYSDVFVL